MRTHTLFQVACLLSLLFLMGAEDSASGQSYAAQFGMPRIEDLDADALQQLQSEVKNRIDAFKQGEQVYERTEKILSGEVGPPSEDWELHVVGVYEGDAFVPGKGVVEVRVTHKNAPIILVLTAYESVQWQLHLDDGVQVKQIILGGAHEQYVAGVPDGVSIADYSRSRESGKYLPYCYTDRSASPGEESNYLPLKKELKSLTNLEINTFQGRYSPQNHPIIVGPESKDWNEFRAKANLVDAYRYLTRFDREKEMQRLLQVPFFAISPVMEDQSVAQYPTPHGTRDCYVGMHSILGPVAGQAKRLALPSGIFALDPQTLRLYSSNMTVTDFATDPASNPQPLPSPELVPEFSHPCAAAFDTKRNRFLLTTLGGEGELFAYDVGTAKWSLMRSADNADIAAMAYDEASDLIFWLNPNSLHTRQAELIGLYADGVVERRVPIKGSVLIHPHDPFQSGKFLAVRGDYLCLFAADRHAESPVAPVEMKVQLINARSGDIAYEGPLCAPGTIKTQLTELERRIQRDQVGQTPRLADEPPVKASARSTAVDILLDRPVNALLNRQNGHYYEFYGAVDLSWEQAKDLASKRNFKGMQGYLATITTLEENQFLSLQFFNRGTAWIGATDSEQEGVWKWATGPEAGQVLNATNDGDNTTTLAFWAAGEPSNSGRGEHYAAWNWSLGQRDVEQDARWNDFPADRTLGGLIIEFSSETAAVDLDGPKVNE